MPLNISELELEQAAKKEVYDARRKGKLSELTPRLVRQTIERKFKLQKGTLDADEFEDLRAELKSAIKEAATEDLPPADVEVSKTKKRKSEEILESKPKKKQDTKPQKPKKGSTKQFKSSVPTFFCQFFFLLSHFSSSRETVPTSDIEDTDVNDTANTSAAGPSGESTKENEAVASKMPKTSNLPKPSGSVAKPSPRPSTSSTPEAPAADSDSELSVLEDEPPKRKKSKMTKPKDKGAEKSQSSKGKKAANVSLNKDEETIKRLKSLVLACGVRRQWAKVFKDVDSPSQQIRILKQTLTDLGMSGRMSLEQAKAIKEKRELAQELEDVQAFAAAATRSKARKPSEEDEEESEEEELPAKRKTNARKSIMDFLGDQSDDDD
ncbi:E3 ubiquitin isg15 ligase trim25-like [Mycena venus]|uniref:E3 ubiquitin isg15 ligase trim25-like n=1 Tax=Mycena venus TaxID=2733690 RepID=A0A8H6YW15_9AGAR|nr:E3 ubiquitin isg15 ligase trim25-like [Mycena venus]